MQRWTHRLEGLEPDNFLAFMALLGLLRALETVRPNWCPRAAWDLDRAPWRPVLSLRVDVSREEVAAASAEGCRSYAELCRPLFETALERLVDADKAALRKFDEDNSGKELTDKKKKEREKIERRTMRTDPHSLVDLAREAGAFRELNNLGDHHHRAAVSAWCGEFHDKREISVRSSPLKLVAGQMRFVGTALKLAEGASDIDLFNSLFKDWKFRHRGDSFRFSHQEVRQYAYMASDPSQKEKRPRKRKGSNELEITGDGVAPSERGANTLAALAFESFPPVFAGRVLAVSGMVKPEKREISWPLIGLDRNKIGVSISGLRSVLLRGVNSRNHECLWMTAKIIEPEKDYLNVTPGVSLTPPGP